jgi:hypothetical protein
MTKVEREIPGVLTRDEIWEHNDEKAKPVIQISQKSKVKTRLAQLGVQLTRLHETVASASASCLEPVRSNAHQSSSVTRILREARQIPIVPF